MERADDGDRRPLLGSAVEKGQVLVVEHDAAERLGHEFVLDPVDFDPSTNGARRRDLSRLQPELVAPTIIFVRIVEDQGTVKLSLSLPTLAANAISAFGGRSVALIPLLSDPIES